MRPDARAGLTALLFLLGTVSAAPLSAQEVSWRTSYNAARQEARARNLPLLMDFGTKQCFWCRKLEQTTFRDPGVADALGRHFVTVKIDAEKYPSLVQALGIRSYPTLVIASPAGEVLDVQVGYVDAARFRQQLQGALAKLESTPPAGVQLAGGSAGVAAGEDGGVRPASLRQPGGADRLQTARQLLALAEEEYRTQQFAACFLHCKTVAASFPDQPEGQAARQLLQKLTADAGQADRTARMLLVSLCELYLERARHYAQAGQADQAAAHLEWVTRSCPDSTQAQAARTMLDQLRKR